MAKNRERLFYADLCFVHYGAAGAIKSALKAGILCWQEDTDSMG